MSIEQAKAFIEKMKTDKAFNDEVMTIEDLNERMAHIAKAGFEFTEEEIKQIYTVLMERRLIGGLGWRARVLHRSRGLDFDNIKWR
ncbi:MAG TPA: Nif11-like leader peptide family natural product precursor [Desulfobacterales bacterium]|jgi:predicted ribosomally synthesized peptide with nif11-like leader|nr:Nif11-like leader peptide family natural product precursor [Desulfobacterales bacterium]